MAYFFFNEVPQSSVIIGSILIIMASIFIAFRENKIENKIRKS